MSSQDPVPVRPQPGASQADLVQALQGEHLSSTHLRELVSHAYAYHKAVGGPIRVFPKGIPAPDSLEATFAVRGDALRILVDRIIADERVVNLRTFPLGIPKPELFHVAVEFR